MLSRLILNREDRLCFKANKAKMGFKMMSPQHRQGLGFIRSKWTAEFFLVEPFKSSSMDIRKVRTWLLIFLEFIQYSMEDVLKIFQNA